MGGTEATGRPRVTQARTVVLFRVGLGLTFLAAFLSMAAQLRDLVGSRGLLPLGEYLGRYQAAGVSWLGRIHTFPTLFWIDHADPLLTAVPLLGAAVSLLMIAGVGGRAVPVLLWILYLSCVAAGRDFFYYQWDNLLLETSFLAIFLPARGTCAAWFRGRPLPEPSPVVVVLLRWVLFRLLFESALAKIVYGADDWLTLKAMTYYYETAPLPSWGGWLVQQFPLWIHQASVFVTFLCELVLPFLIFVRPRAPRLVFFVLQAGFQAIIASTSNYGFFNLLSFALSLLVLDDRHLDLLSTLGRRRAARVATGAAAASSVPESPAISSEREVAPASAAPGRRPPLGAALRYAPWGLAALILPASTIEGVAYFSRGPFFNQELAPLRRLYAPFRSVNDYHLFPGIVRERIVAEIEGSRDGVEWLPLHLRYAPGDPRQRPPVTGLHNPRFPFTYSFFTLGRGARDAEYMSTLAERLCCDPRAVASLMEPNPFQEKGPAALRLSYYRYRFGTWADLERSGDYWLREQVRPPSRPIPCSCPPGR